MSIVEPPVVAPPRIELDRADYLRLLINASETDPARWPEGCRQGASLLARIREIEQDCVREHGRWHPDLLPPGGEGEYESLCVQLDNLIEPPDLENAISAEELYAELGITPRAAS